MRILYCKKQVLHRLIVQKHSRQPGAYFIGHQNAYSARYPAAAYIHRALMEHPTTWLFRCPAPTMLGTLPHALLCFLHFQICNLSLFLSFFFFFETEYSLNQSLIASIASLPKKAH
jgi:hypothetical protein